MYPSMITTLVMIRVTKKTFFNRYIAINTFPEQSSASDHYDVDKNMRKCKGLPINQTPTSDARVFTPRKSEIVT